MGYRSPQDIGYCLTDFKRFEALAPLKFESVLDVGSGPCQLLKWLKGRSYLGQYEATDIRSSSLALCDCKTYSALPSHHRYDVVCLFGVADYCDEVPVETKRQGFKELLERAATLAERYVVFSVVQDSVNFNNLVRYSLAEAEALGACCGGTFEVFFDMDPTEYVVLVSLL